MCSLLQITFALCRFPGAYMRLTQIKKYNLLFLVYQVNCDSNLYRSILRKQVPEYLVVNQVPGYLVVTQGDPKLTIILPL